MVKYKQSIICFIFFILAVMILPKPLFADDIPQIRLNYGHGPNHTALSVALALEDKYVQDGYYVHAIIPKERYELVKDGKPVAILNLIAGKSATETGTMYAQKHVDMALCSLTGIIVAVDKGTKVRIVSPLILATGGLVLHKDTPPADWDAFISYAKSQSKPLRIGYHSPNSAPVIIFRGALNAEGVTYTNDPFDTKANITLVDLKNTQNLHPALLSKQVDGAVGPDPFPQTCVFQGYGKFIKTLRDMPPAGKWATYPCCVVSASQDMLDNNPEVVQHVVNFINASSKWCTDNPEKAGMTAAGWMGLDPEVGKNLHPVHVQSFTDSWKDGADGFLMELNKANYFKGALKDKTFKEIDNILIDYRFVK